MFNAETLAWIFIGLDLLEYAVYLWLWCAAWWIVGKVSKWIW